MLGALLARQGEALTRYPGGCLIGSRPIDLHIKALKTLGAEITEEAGNIYARTERLRGAEIHFPYPSVGATENAMLAACGCPGITTIVGAAREPEIEDLCGYLNACGARIAVEKDGVITGYRASVNPEVFDYRIKAFINLEVEPVRKKEFYPYITDCPNVIECNCVTGDYSMLMEVVFHTTSELDQFIGQLQHFGRTKTQIVFSTSVEHRGIPLGDTRIPILEQEEEKG